ncbi:hypothetical protein ACLB2K_049316 [Fragaria x ananassa]
MTKIIYLSPNLYLIFGGWRLPPIFWAKFRKPTLRQPESYAPLNHDVSSSISPSPPPPHHHLLLRFEAVSSTTSPSPPPIPSRLLHHIAVSSSDSMPPTSGKRKRQAEQSQRLLQEVAQQYRRPTEVPSRPMAPPSSLAPPLPPPLPDVDKPSSDDHQTGQSFASPPKTKTEVVKGLKAEEIVKRTGRKIKVTWDDFCHGSNSKELSSMLTHDVGHIIRDEISMVAATWGDTTEDEQKKLPTKLFIFYEFDVDDKLMWKWLDDKAKNAYKNLKCTINTIRKGKPREDPRRVITPAGRVELAPQTLRV